MDFLTEQQKECVKLAVDRYKSGEKYTTIAGYAGTGKAQPVDTIIPTPDGYKKLGDIRVGDKVFDRNGLPTTVLKVFPQGQLPCYKVTFSDGRTTECNDEHLWTYIDDDGYHTCTLREMMDNDLKRINEDNVAVFKYAIPVCNPVCIKSYDGRNLKGKSFIKQLSLIVQYGTFIQREKFLEDIIRVYGTDTIYNNVWIVSLLNTNFVFMQLTQRLLYSLGATKAIVRVEGKDKYTLYSELPTPNDTANKKIYIEKVEKLDIEKEMVCLYVDNIEHLYLTNDYIVTHNTTVVKYIIDELNLKPDQVTYATYTGKAAQVLIQKGNKEAQTLHKLLFKTVLLPNGTYASTPKENLGSIKLVVVDEVSMVPLSFIEQLLSHDVHVIFLGDPAQLPPVKSKETNVLLDSPHIFLSEIKRQDADSEIIKLTMDIRAGKPLQEFHGNTVQVLPKKALNDGMLEWADQVIVGKNDTRVQVNNLMRKMRGFPTETPVDGDKVICLKNEWEILSEKEQQPLVNGTIGTLSGISEFTIELPYMVGIKQMKLDVFAARLLTETEDTYYSLKLDKNVMFGGNPQLDPKIKYRLLKSKHKWQIPVEFTYAYAITCHKSQGSQWDNVLVIEESFPFGAEHQSWLYTAATRAAKKLVIIMKD